MTDTTYGSGHGTVKSYIVGFALSIILTIASYIVVVNRMFDSAYAIIIAITILAVAQLFVQLMFFLHLGSESKPRWNLVTFAFAVLIVVILVGGSLWIMHNLNYNMMMDH